MNDWVKPAHRLCVEKYSKNNFQLIDQLSAHAKQIAQAFDVLIPLYQSFHTKLEKLRITAPKSQSPTSVYRELCAVSDTDNDLVELFKVMETSMNTLSDALKPTNTWGETYSSFEDYANQQKHMISNIVTFTSFSGYMNSLKKATVQMKNFADHLGEENLQQLETASKSVVEERASLLRVDQKTTDNENEGVPHNFQRAMYALYFTPRSLEGVFRQCADTTVLNDCSNLIGVLDIQTIDNVCLSGVIRKFLRDADAPVWPSSLLQNLLTITKKYEKDQDMWVDNVQQLTCRFPKRNSEILKHVLALCGKIISNPESKMDGYNISVCLGLSVLVSKTDLQAALEAPLIIKTFELFIQNRTRIFTDIEDCFKRRLSDVFTPPIYHDIFYNKRESIYFKRHNPRTSDGGKLRFNIGNKTKSVSLSN
ncbi:hypothetical protein EIN_505140 [Entamoeba invadens IP1]|uniref:Rho-GAP domain-containing protein n=1 Tax=Entamoeba invadens IP1 TaxID=370355 RepID=A0A0A1UDB8_ENTIV|nr:hypothetical protein EIN_505140 [Entamoeba invadens IP1]ELP90308.1 hypothetical protein EIN_505140 [Entamoeba invadens IP1]|eukprot:XP_004257079.1 hypothetical protein EIN_505140 [Entamoeba invadens IP1]